MQLAYCETVRALIIGKTMQNYASGFISHRKRFHWQMLAASMANEAACVFSGGTEYTLPVVDGISSGILNSANLLKSGLQEADAQNLGRQTGTYDKCRYKKHYSVVCSEKKWYFCIRICFFLFFRLFF